MLPSAFIVLALLALLLVPLRLQRDVGQIRDEIQHAADPARTLVTEIQYLLARQTSTLRGYLISGDTSLIGQYRVLAARERDVYNALEPLVGRLDAGVLRRFGELRALSAYWHAEVDQELLAGERATRGGIPFEIEIYLEALKQANELDASVARATADRRERIARAERRARWLQGGLGLLALAAVVAAAWLTYRVQQLARESNARRREAEVALAESARAMESKARLIRGVTHDVKNPLGAADGYAELLEMELKGPLSPAQARVVAGIRRSIHGALEIIHDLLELSRAEAGDLPIEPRATDLARLVEAVVEEYRGAAGSRGHALELVLEGNGPPVVTDPARVRQILGNLLGNAIKYTPGGGRLHVSVCHSPDPRSGSGGWVGVRVADSGPGIPEADHGRIFDEFFRLDASGTDGHGLGLAISRRLARLLQGEITVESEAGRGSIFTLWLPTRNAGGA